MNRLEGLKKALAHSGGTHSLRDVADQIRAGEAQVWEEKDALLLTQIVETPQARVLHFWIAVGDLEAVKTLSEKVIDWGRKNGCVRATLAGRRGWAKALGPEWKQELVLMGRKIDGQGQEKHSHDDSGPGKPSGD